MAEKLYAQSDQEIDGTPYNAGDPIDPELHAGTREVLRARGDIGSQRPAVTITVVDPDKPIEDMTRDELITSIRIEAPLDHKDDDELREMLAHVRAENVQRKDDRRAENKDEGDRPLTSMTIAQLDAVAAAENVTFGDDVITKADRVAAIQAARDAAKS